MADLVIKDLHVSVENKEILKGLSLTVKSGERHALMGPNGNGKSTLLAAIMGNPKYTVTSGSITLDGKDVLQMSSMKEVRQDFSWVCNILVLFLVLQTLTF